MNKNLYRKLYEVVTKKKLKRESRKNGSGKYKEKFGEKCFCIEESMIEDILHQFFLFFYTKIKDLPDTDTDSIIKFINFPENTKIELTAELTEKKILAEAEIALEMAMSYFSEYIERLHSEFMQECLEESQIFVLCELSREGRVFKLSKDGREVFNHKVKLHSRFADQRMLIDKVTGPETKWTRERMTKTIMRMEELEKILIKCKSLFSEETNAEKRTEQIVQKIPTLKSHENKINILLRTGSKISIKDTALEILQEELNEIPGFKLNSIDYLKRRITDFKRDLRKDAA